jgi:hypothetical protein
MLLAVDPGVRSPGVALFHHGVLHDAARITGSSSTDGDHGARWLEVAYNIVNWAFSKSGGWKTLHVVFEKPQIYTWSKSKGDPNDLIGLAGIGGAVCGLLHSQHPVKVSSPKPDEWIGQLSKVCPTCKGKAKKKCSDCHGSAWETPRGRRIRSRLSPAELALVPDQNDAIDAVGLGLFVLSRLEPVRVFSNGR